MSKSRQMERGIKYRNADKMALIPIKNMSTEPKKILCKPEWMKIKLPVDSKRIREIKSVLRKNNLHSVCEEASCPNLAECFNHGTATFMILGTICTRRCPFCDVAHGRPNAADENEPAKLAQTISDMKLKYVVVTSVDRDDLRDGGAKFFADCIREIRVLNPKICIETLVPDFRGCMNIALKLLNGNPPDVFNHNLETAPRLYRKTRPGANYKGSLELLKKFSDMHPNVPTKSGIMMGLGETQEEIIQVLQDLREHSVTMLTLGQYMAPSRHHLPVERYVSPKEFYELRDIALKLGFTSAACGPFVRSSYHADLQAQGIKIE
ncbi:lipoyl synthase [Candidatus Enterovibrio altilux]|nr:lipoyl synthase [Candidatus Enterovibrio luxaltus]